MLGNVRPLFTCLVNRHGRFYHLLVENSGAVIRMSSGTAAGFQAAGFHACESIGCKASVIKNDK